MTHAPTPHHDMYRGYWFTCTCKWSGASRPTKHLAMTLFDRHKGN